MSATQTVPSEEVRLDLNKDRILFVALGSFAFVWVCWFLWPRATEFRHISETVIHLLIFVGVPLFSTTGIFACIKMFDSAPGFSMNSHGLVDNTNLGSVGPVRWAEVESVKVMKIDRRSKACIVVLLKNPTKFLARRPLLGRVLGKINLRTYGSPVVVSPWFVDAEAEELAKQMLLHLGASSQAQAL